MSKSNKVIVAVTGVHATDNPGPGIGVAKSLKAYENLDVEVFGLAYDAMEPGIYIDGVLDRSFLVPYLSADTDAFIERLAYIKHNYGLDVLIPTLDSELMVFIQIEDKLKRMGIKVFMPSKKCFELRNKDKLAQVAKDFNISAPEQEVVASYEELSSAIEKIGLPAAVKGALYKAYMCKSMEEVITNFGKIVSEWGYPVLLQKAVSGEEMNVIGLGDGEGGCLGLVAIKKLSVTDMGKIWSGVTVHHDKLLSTAKEFVSKTKWRGAFEIECIVDHDDVYLIEINPRFPAWVYFASAVGVNLPGMMVEALVGDALPEAKTEYDFGKLYMRYTEERVCDMNMLENIVIKGEVSQ